MFFYFFLLSLLQLVIVCCWSFSQYFFPRCYCIRFVYNFCMASSIGLRSLHTKNLSFGLKAHEQKPGQQTDGQIKETKARENSNKLSQEVATTGYSTRNMGKPVVSVPKPTCSKHTLYVSMIVFMYVWVWVRLVGWIYLLCGHRFKYGMYCFIPSTSMPRKKYLPRRLKRFIHSVIYHIYM